mmetsp:Transcript_18337/g.42258  ORF Transcript_18337/g.42258 Transcript_18337/m.42258 type:complete len:473 (-) Transcript_18337:2338-3756(-)|eukprot:CAMPEP_0197180570 /NCGR_PEP_ID=MMETSP1423-20130617/5136_1 /TAXON_ID=476441 /ORGANISM="Pseudo-nitzschia heimii, Strain UNC1101" /LENGTH=472 /DNA_ID=CAMNT_0042630665 /DNA_START=56 /DNA_END=1474 /DNA_ORIENTATION=+
MSNEPTETTKGDNAACDGKVASVNGAPAKKKRGASHQITKNDFEDCDNDEAENEDKLKQGFSRASDEVLLKRKIYKVKRSSETPKPTNAEAQNGTGEAPTPDSSTDKESTTKTGSSSSNPFASTILASSTEKATELVKSPKKVFGFGSASGFGATGSGSSGFGGGEGFAGVGSSGKSSGFGSSGSTGTSEFAFASSSSTTKSLFGNSDGSGITFSLSKESDTRNASASTKTVGTTETTKLPDKVDLKTGEEDEDAIQTVRCKSHEWVEDDGGKISDSVGSNGDNDSKRNKANPSIQSSTQFQAAISTVNSNVPDKKGSGDVKGDKSDSSSTRENGTEGTASDRKSSANAVKFRWMELGIGPVKILKSKSNPERLRLVQRRESSKMGPATKVILNIPLWKESTCERKKDDLRYVYLNSIKEGKVCQYLFKFKENADAGIFFHHLTEHIPIARQCFAGTAASKAGVVTPAQKDS